ncbi:hypothetical protein WDW89_00360, partial [Deltaproteobacteria bacterium TL4]
YKANYSKSLGDGKKWVLKPEKDWVIRKVEPIISEEIWDRCNHILNEREKKNKKPSKKAVHLFTGYAVCHCGNKMYIPSDSIKYTCLKCKNKIPMTDLEDLFHHQLKQFFFSSDEITNYLDKADQTIKTKEELLRSAEEEKKKIEREMDKIYQAYIADQITKEGFGKQYKPLEERLKQKEEQIPEIQAEIDFLRIQYLSSGQIVNEAKDLYTQWPELETAEKRKVIENVTDKIIIGTDDITINLCYLPSTSEITSRRQHNFRDSSLRSA